MISNLGCGENGIRTHEALLELTHFPGVRLRPTRPPLRFFWTAKIRKKNQTKKSSEKFTKYTVSVARVIAVYIQRKNSALSISSVK